MRTDRNHLLAALALAGAAFAAGCGKAEVTPPVAVATAPVAATSVGTQIDDTVVTAKVKSALLADPDIKSLDLKVETRKGEVQLSGYVASQTQIDRAVAITHGVEGVRGIENSLSLKEGNATLGNKVDDGIITAKVKSALLADPSVKSFDIAVATRMGAVQLSGFVDSQAQIDNALALATKVEGVTSVGNEMSIKK
jgi:hyperosmotically inducible protein